MKKNDKLQYIDENKTRRNLLMFNKYKLPVYTVMDKIQEYDNEEIECGMSKIENKNHMPLRGNGWYMHNTVIEC